MKKAAISAVIFIFAIVFCVKGAYPGQNDHVPGVKTFSEIYFYLQEVHVSKPSSEDLLEGAIQGMIHSLNDPYTQYLSPEQLKDFQGALEGEYVGVGVHLEQGEVYPKVVDVLKNSPASSAGILSGDQIIKVDGADIAGEQLVRVVQRIRGPEGTKVVLTVRKGKEDKEYELIRSNIYVPTVKSSLMSSGAGYITIDSFGNNTASEFKKSLNALTRQGADKLILDLRYNPGGVIQAAAEIAGCFLDKGQLVFSTVERDGSRQEYRTEGAPIAKGLPVVVLINKYSASASEILAGSLHDHGVAKLVGEYSFGKGTVQSLLHLTEGGALKITSARHHTPRDRVIEGIGLNPDIHVLTPELVMAVAQRLLLRADTYNIQIKKENQETLVNNYSVELKQPFILHYGEYYIPIRFVFESLGYRVIWNIEDGSIRMLGHGGVIIIHPGSGKVSYNGTYLPEADVIFSEEGKAYIPVSCLGHLNIKAALEGSQIFIEK